MTTSWRKGLATLPFLALALAACDAPRQLAANGSGAPQEASAYLLGPGDTLTVFVYRAPELSAPDLPVRPDGRISLPLIPDIQAAGRSPTQLARDIEGQLRQYVREPNVTVMVRTFMGPSNQQIRVIGEAAQPMGLPYRDGMTVMDVVIGARGLTRYAAGNRAEIIRRDPEGRREVIRVRLNDLMRGGDVSQDLAMRPGDTLVIPQGWF
ncbi:sugar ABC transporter substrate-binding protein [Roseococcus sp. SYP-B2431]|uniref:XrtA/PEP-CTERM system exopolysaccharide export protein n=1 Tax=Roseococcus sp. SYP-B2431 TaxID=2496640 RepID=UPI00103B4D1C|nr:XrtA/PEP-CTERM system exopolysaccharide export protein [Roseococcus sp. SYP-B2431]TCH96289.1 sugar ABC transporter substrate-binding protein [Roseococcus sp. SYP-B2431]